MVAHWYQIPSFFGIFVAVDTWFIYGQVMMDCMCEAGDRVLQVLSKLSLAETGPMRKHCETRS